MSQQAQGWLHGPLLMTMIADTPHGRQKVGGSSWSLPEDVGTRGFECVLNTNVLADV